MTLSEMRDLASGAVFSECGKYRFALWRHWDFDGSDCVMFIGLNPSTANKSQNDPTIRRVIALAKNWGYGGVYMMNLFPFITAYPSKLEECSTEMINENDRYIKAYAKITGDVVFAWGAFPVLGRDRTMMKMFPKAKALAMNNDGSPKHPLYVPANTASILYTPVK